MAEKKKKDPPAAGGDQDAKIAGLEAKISELSKQLEAALEKKQVDPNLVEALTNRIASLETKLEEAEKMRNIELPAGDPPADDQDQAKTKKPAAKKKPVSSGGEGGLMF
jgi:uncharacterized coiled-coil DUF342 family protein